MIRVGNMATTVVAMALLIGCSGAATAQDSAGYFTQEQADKGASLFDANCSACHGKNLEGIEAPGLVGIDVMGNWATAEGIYAYFSVAMPPTAPGKLGEDAYVDILAHIMSVNGAPAGTKELTGDEATLSAGAPAAPAAAAAPTVPQAFTWGKELPTVGGAAAAPAAAAPAEPAKPTVPQAFTAGKDLPTVTPPAAPTAPATPAK
jgi:mono/diheme cytochrome c family protein